MSNSYGLIAVISQRLRNNVITFAIFREFERDGVTDRTNFIPEELGEVYLEFAKLVVERVQQLRASGTLPARAKT